MSGAAGHPVVTLVLVPGAGTGEGEVGRTVASLRAQTLDGWELLVPAGTPAPADERVRALDGGLDAALDAALSGARGTWWGLVDAGDTLEPDALELLCGALTARPGAVLGYTDEDRPAEPDRPAGSPEPGAEADPPGVRLVRKPDWSPERERHGHILGRLCLLRTATARAVGGWDATAEPAAEYDLVLRVTERGGEVVHVAETLYHGQDRPVPAEHDAAALAAAQRHVTRLGLPATVVPGPVPGVHRLVRTLDPAVTVSIVIPTRWQTAEVRGALRCLPVEAVRSMLARTEHPAIEVVVVYDEPVPEGVLDELRTIAGDRLVAVPYRKPFNFSEKCNVGFLHARGDVVVLANDDLEPASDRWLESLCAPALEPDVGLVGTKLIFEDGTVQHGGHVHVRDARLAYRGRAADDVGDMMSLVVDHEVSGVSGACLALRREVYEQVGGLCEQLPLSYNDVDLSLKITAAGLRILWLAEPVLYHFESKSRDPKVLPGEYEFMAARWGEFAGDAYLPWLGPRPSRRTTG